MSKPTARGAKPFPLWHWIGRSSGIFVMEDPPRADSKEVIGRLKGLGFQVHLLTGDGEVVAERVGRERRGGCGPG